MAQEQILLYGIKLTAAPTKQVVPRDIATIVSTVLQAPNFPDGSKPPIPADAVVRATLRGPSLEQPRELTAAPGGRFNIPPLTVAGVHTLDNIRLVKGDQVLLFAEPESVVIEVIDRLLVTQVTARPLTAAEIRERGLVFDSSSFQAYDFTAAFAVANGNEIRIDFPIILPKIAGAGDPRLSTAGLPNIKAPTLKSLSTIIPDTLEIQAQVPNLSVRGFILTYQPKEGQNLTIPPIPGVVVIPGDIGFLNQVFSVLLMVGNVAPEGSNLVVSDATAEIVLPKGRDEVVFTPDDPLAMGRTAGGETPRVQRITLAGQDGKLGTADDDGDIGPGESGNAEFLVEGRREGSHIVEMEIAATLNGLPIGPVPIRGRAAGEVLVRNPTFTLTFTHPDVVNVGEPYTLDVTVTNTSLSPANFVSLNLNARNVVGATVSGEATQQIETIPPGDSATVTYNLVALVSGKVTAATLDSDGKVAGRFDLRAAIGELGVPLSPDSLVLPKEANALPPDLRRAAIALLGRAYAVATAPPAAVPADVTRFTKKIVWDRAVEVAEAGLRVTLHEPVADSAAHLWMDFAGSNFARLEERVSRPENLPFERSDFNGFDELRRRSVRGDVFADAVAAQLGAPLTQLGAVTFHQQFAEKMSYRPGHISVLLSGGGSALPATLQLRDGSGRRLGGAAAQNRFAREIPFGDFLAIRNGQGEPIAYVALIATPDPGAFTIAIDRVAGTQTPLTLSVVTPDASGNLHHRAFENLTTQTPTASFGTNEPHPFTVVTSAGGQPAAGAPLAPSRNGAIADPGPALLGAVQQKDADLLICAEPFGPTSVLGRPGRVIALLFSEEVTSESVQEELLAGDITNFRVDGNQVVSVALQPGRRIALLALRDPIGPFVERTITAAGVADRLGQTLPAETVQIETTVDAPGGVVNGRVLQPDGTPVPFANVRLLYYFACGGVLTSYGISSKTTDESGGYSWDYVLQDVQTVKVAAIDPAVDQPRSVSFKVQRDGQRMNVDLVFLGRGTLRGRTLGPNGVTALAGTVVRARSLTDSSEYGAVTGDDGSFTLLDVPVGTLVLEAVNVNAKVESFVSELIPFAGAAIARDFILFPVGEGSPIARATLRGHVLHADGAVAAEVPVVLYYRHGSQPGLPCTERDVEECAIAITRTDAAGAFAFVNTYAGSHRVYAFDEAAIEEGSALTTLTSGADVPITIVLSGGLGTVTGVVLDAAGNPVPDARVGGGFSIVNASPSGGFVLPDVPVGHREIVAVSEALRTTGKATVDIPSAGATVPVTVVLRPTASVAGKVTEATGAPVVNNKVVLFEKLPGRPGEPPRINVLAQTTTDAEGRYQFDRVAIQGREARYFVSAFRADFSDGNVEAVSLRYQGQLFRADIVFKGGGRGQVVGRVLDADGVTPLAARVAISGEQPIVAGGQVGVGFQHVEHYRIVDTDFTTGQFAFSGVWAGRFVLTAVGQFSPDPVTGSAQMPPGQATIEVNLRLTATSRITGIVLQPDGVTPAGAGVVVRFKSDSFKTVCTETEEGETQCVRLPQGIQDEQVVTGADGRFEIPLVNAGMFTITVGDPATRRAAQVKGEVKPGQDPEIPIRLLGLGNVTIRVFGSGAQTVIPDANVVVEQIGFPEKKITRRAVGGVLHLTGEDAFSEGTFTVMATDTANGFAGRATGRITTDGEEVTVRVFLFNAAGTVKGFVLAPDGNTPVANAEVVLSNEGGPLAFVVTSPDGSYSIAQIPLGAFTLDSFEAATARRGFASGQVFLDGQEVPVNIRQLGVGLVKGRVLRAGDLEPLVNWQVSLDQISPTGRVLDTLRTTTGLDGEYTFPGASVGSVRVTASLPDTTGTGGTTSAVTRDGQVLELPIVVTIARPLVGRVVGRVRNPNLTAAAHATVELRQGLVPLFANADANGEFAIEDVPLGRFNLIARAQGSLDVGGAMGEIRFENEVDAVDVTLTGLSEVTGIVQYPDGSSAGRQVEVKLDGDPASGCFVVCTPGEVDPNEGVCPVDGRRPITCSAFTDDDGRFAFLQVPARTFTLFARQTVSGLTGSAGGALNPGQSAVVRVVLEPNAVITGRALLENGAPASGAAVELTLPPLVPGGNARGFYVRAGPDGAFRLQAIPLAAFTLVVQDPLGAGIARRTGTLAGNLTLGDVLLDEAAPRITALVPALGAIQVPRNSTVRITFSEPILPGTVGPETVSVSSPAGIVAGTLQVSGGDTVVTFTPIAPLRDQTRHTITVAGVQDRLGKPMAGSFSASFTTVDVTPPAAVDITPTPAANGVTIYTTVRLRYSEPVDVSKFSARPIQVTTTEGAVDGRIDYLFGNTVVVFTPARPLSEDRTYAVQVDRAFDLSGLPELQPAAFSFGTTDRTPPQLAGLTASNDGRVITNSFVTVTADVGTSHDVSVVDFFVNGTFAATARQAPFAIPLQAVPALGGPGDQIRVEAFGVDTSGNRSTTPVQTDVLIVRDEGPGVVILAPAGGASFRNGAQVDVSVRASDDLGVALLGYRAATGRPQDAGSRTYDPALLSHTQTFSFAVPTDAAPGSTIQIDATGVDTKGERTSAAPVTITVLDAVPPVVTITGVSTGERVRPGEPATAVVSAQDLGGIASITFSASGVVSTTETRAIEPPRSPVLTSFTFNVPATARPGDSVRLDATARDRAGNTTSAAQIILPIADTVAPTAALRTASGRLDIAPGETITVFADVEDEIAVSRVELTGTGAFTLTDARQVAPPAGSASVPFTIAAPVTAASGAVLTLAARATDTSNNTSAPALLALSVRAVADVSLPASVLLAAGETVQVQLTLASPAPAGGLRVDVSSGAPTIAAVPGFVLFGAGETVKAFALQGVSGGTATVTALIQGVPRATMPATVRGGVVSGFVLSPTLIPVSGAQVTVRSTIGGSSLVFSTTSGPDGRYFVEGANGPPITVRALDPISRFMGFKAGTLNRPNGFVHLDVTLAAAGSIAGTVLMPDGETPAGAGVTVHLVDVAEPDEPAASATTDGQGRYEFGLVPIGSYRLDASDLSGNRGRAEASVTASGQSLDVAIQFLGRGTVTGVVLDGANQPVPNTALRFTSRTIFGAAPAIQTNAGLDGTFRFDNVLVGEFTIVASDDATDQAGTASGEVRKHLEVVPISVRLSNWGGLAGTVYRADGTTPVAGAQVSAHGVTTTTDPDGRYELTQLPLGAYTLAVSEPATRGLAQLSGTLTNHGATETVDVRLLAQGTLLVTVTTAQGAPVPDAALRIEAKNGPVKDGILAKTGPDGTAIVQRVLAGTFEVTALSNGLAGSAEGTLAADAVLPVTVTLEPTASVAGTIYLPGGEARASSGTVSVNGGVEHTIQPDGTYRIDGLRLGNAVVVVRDGQGRRRAQSAPINLAAGGTTVTVDLTYVALGTVSGRVITPEGASASSLVVTLRSSHPLFGGTIGTSTNAAGFYEFADVPAGAFSVSVVDPARGLVGEGAGAIELDGQTYTADVLLQANAINVPAVRHDVHNFRYQLEPSGAIAGARLEHAQLDVSVGAQTTRFSGAPVGTSEHGGREIAVRQQGLIGGLQVMRKAFVPLDGYFVRHLEILSNPTGAPIAARLRVSTTMHAWANGGLPSVAATSSGDALLDPAADTWAVVDDSIDVDPAVSDNTPATAFVVGGAGAALAADAFDFSRDDSAQVQSRWSTIVVPPGGTVAVMHFFVSQTSRSAAVASAERLSLLAPEAMTSLSPAEIGWIRNFAVPTDGVSTLPPLPRLTGQVSGRALAADAQTPITTAGVQFRSTHPIFGRRLQRSAGADGAFELTGTVADGSSVVIPVHAFQLFATHLVTNSKVVVNGSFEAGATTAIRDVVFSNTGTFQGFVRRHGGQPVPFAPMQIQIGSFASAATARADGSFLFTGLAPGSYTVAAQVEHPQGTALPGTLVEELTAGETVTRDVVLLATGNATGIVQQPGGQPASDVAVELAAPGFAYSTRTDSAGRFTFTDVPAIAYSVRASAPVFHPAEATVTAIQDQTVARNLAFTADTVPPAIAVLSPTAPVSAAPGATVHISVRATDDLGVRRIDLSAAGVLAATDSREFDPPQVSAAAGFALTVPVGTAPGIISVSLVARDAAGNASAPAPVTITVTDVSAPSVVIRSPAAGASIDPRAPLPVSVEAADDRAVARVTLSASGVTTFAATRDVNPPTASRTEQLEIAFETLPATGGSLTLNATASDAAGNTGAAAAVTVQVRDVVPPQVLSTEPADGATGVDPAATVFVRFSEAVERASAMTAVRLIVGGSEVATTRGFADADRTVTLTPVQPLPENTFVTIEVGTGVRDAAGNQPAAAVTGRFRTRSPDSLAPRVAAFQPASGAVDVPVSTVVRVTFDEPIARPSITTASFRLSSNGTPIAGTYSFDANDTIVQLTPTQPLPFGAVIVIELTGAITDRFDNALANSDGTAIVQPITSTFLTGSFGIASPRPGDRVLEQTRLRVRATATASLGIANVLFSVNGVNLPAAAAPFEVDVDVPSAAASPTLRITAVARNASNVELARDEITVAVISGIRFAPRVVGVPLNGTGAARITVSTPGDADLDITLAPVNPGIVSVPAVIRLAAGQTAVSIPVTGLAAGNTTVLASSSRGTADAIVTVSVPVPGRELRVGADIVGAVVRPPTAGGLLFAPVNAGRLVSVRLLETPAGSPTPVTITSSNPAVARVEGDIVIPAGSSVAAFTITTGAAGQAHLILRAGSSVLQITVVVGQAPSNLLPPILARSVGINVLPPSAGGQIYLATAGRRTLTLTLLSQPATTTVPVEVTSTDAAVATVLNSPVVAPGSSSVTLEIAGGSAGSAILTLRAGTVVRAIGVAVGTPPPAGAPLVIAPSVGIALQPAPSAGRLFTQQAVTQTFGITLFETAAVTPVTFTVTSSNPAVADVTGPVVVPAGSTVATLTITTGIAGTATLTLRAGDVIRAVTVTVGAAHPSDLPVIFAAPVGVSVRPAISAGQLITSLGTQYTLSVTVANTPAASAVPVTVTTSDANVASAGNTVLTAGSRTVEIVVATGAEGVAVLRLQFGNQVRDLVVVVGNPPDVKLPVIIAPVVGVQIRQ